MDWRVISLSLILALIIGCTNSEIKDLSIDIPDKKGIIDTIEKDVAATKYFLVSSDTIHTPMGEITKVISTSNRGLKIEQISSYPLNKEKVTAWKTGIKESILDTANKEYTIEYESSKFSLSSIISEVKKQH